MSLKIVNEPEPDPKRIETDVMGKRLTNASPDKSKTNVDALHIAVGASREAAGQAVGRQNCIRQSRNRRRCIRRRGAAMVEFAIVAPLLFFFFFAAFEFCRVAMIRHTVDNAVYEGCRQAIIPGATSGGARATAANVLGTLGLNGSTVTVSPATIDNRTPEVTVTVEVSLDDNTFVPPQFFGGKKITRTLTMQREGSNL